MSRLGLGLGISLRPARIPAVRAYDAATVSFIARAAANGGRALSVSEKTAFDDFVLWCKSYGIWAGRDAMFPVFAIDDATARTSLVNGTYTLSKTGAPVFTAGRGFAGLLAGAGFLQSNFTPSTAGGNYSLNSANMTIHVETGTGNSAIGGGNNGRFTANQTSGLIGGRINDGTTLSGPACGDIQDVLSWNRSAAGALSRWRGGVKYSTDTTAATALDASPWTFCGNDGIGQYSDARLGFISWGSSLTDVQIMALRQGIKTLMLALGSPITFARTAVDSVNIGTLIPGLGVWNTQNASKAWSYTRDGQNHRFELRDGDLWNSTERSEIVNSTNFLNNVDTWLSYAFKWSGTQSGIWHVQGQFHGPDTGPTAGYSPAIALDVDNNGVLSLEINYNTGAGQQFTNTPTGITMVAGQWYNIVLNFKASAATPNTSYAYLYVNGTLVLSKTTNVNIGFSNDAGAGFYPKFGVYRDATTGTTTEIWEFQNMEISTSSLLSRVATPLPIFV